MSGIVVTNLNPAVDRAIHVPELVLGRTARIASGSLFPGGKGANVCRALAALGLSPRCLNLLAGKAGELYASLLEEEGLPSRNIEQPSGQTRFNVTLVSETQAQETHLIDQGPSILSETWQEVLKAFSEETDGADWTVMAGSLPPGLPAGSYAELTRIAGPRRTCLDTSGPPLKAALLSKPWLVKPNLKEAEEALGRALSGKQDFIRAVDEIHELGVKVVALTLGSEGAVLSWQGEIWRGRLDLDRVKSTVGCGDAFLAGAIHTLASGLPADQVLRQALAVAGASAFSDKPASFEERDRLRLLDRVQIERWK